MRSITHMFVPWYEKPAYEAITTGEASLSNDSTFSWLHSHLRRLQLHQAEKCRRREPLRDRVERLRSLRTCPTDTTGLTRLHLTEIGGWLPTLSCTWCTSSAERAWMQRLRQYKLPIVQFFFIPGLLHLEEVRLCRLLHLPEHPALLAFKPRGHGYGVPTGVRHAYVSHFTLLVMKKLGHHSSSCPDRSR